MGFTRYWRFTKALEPLDLENWRLFLNEVEKILKENPDIPIESNLSDNFLILNGEGSAGHEDLCIYRDPGESLTPPRKMCKTNAKDYDPVVESVLNTLARIFPDNIVVSSD